MLDQSDENFSNQQSNVYRVSRVLDCRENYSEEMEEKPSIISFKPFKVLTPEISSMNMMSPFGVFEEMQSSNQSFLSSNTFYQVFSDKNSKLVSTRPIDLQEQIDLTSPWGTLNLPGRLIQLKSLKIKKPIVIRGAPGLVIFLTGSIEIDLQKYKRDHQNKSEVICCCYSGAFDYFHILSASEKHRG